MKKVVVIFSVIALLFSGVSASAYGKYGKDSAECLKYLSFYKDHFKVKNYKDALPNWRKAFKFCPPSANQTMLIDGTSLMRQEINKNKKNAQLRESLIDTLMLLHDLRMQNFPKMKSKALENKVLDMIQYRNQDKKVLYDLCKEAINENKEKTKGSIFVNYMNSSVELYQVGQLDIDQVLADYESCINYLDVVLAANPIDENAKNIRGAVENIFVASRVASCENLIAIFTPKYKADPSNLELLGKIANMMRSTEDCTDNDLYFTAVTELYKADPNYKTAYGLYRMFASKGDVVSANKYLEEAIAFDESDDETDAQYFYEMAVFNHKNGNKSKAYASAQKALALDRDGDITGKANMLCGTIWGSTSCKGGNEIESRAPFWVAVDFMIRAKNADPSLAEEADRLTAQYRQYFPEKSEAFMYNLTDGERYTVNCGGMSAVTTVRTQTK